jgi:hypothetical protein
MGIEASKDEQILKNILYMADYMNKINIKH